MCIALLPRTTSFTLSRTNSASALYKNRELHSAMSVRQQKILMLSWEMADYCPHTSTGNLTLPTLLCGVPCPADSLQSLQHQTQLHFRGALWPLPPWAKIKSTTSCPSFRDILPNLIPNRPQALQVASGTESGQHSTCYSHACAKVHCNSTDQRHRAATAPSRLSLLSLGATASQNS